jgi:hypothetical protein
MKTIHKEEFKDPKEAKDWLDSHFQYHNFTDEQYQALENITNPFPNYTFLPTAELTRENMGKLTPGWPHKEHYEKDQDALREAFNNVPSIKKTVAHVTTNFEALGLDSFKCIKPDGSLNREALENLEKTFTSGIFPAPIVAHLVRKEEKPSVNSMRVRFQLVLRNGTKIAPLLNDSILIEGKQAFQTSDFSFTKIKGTEYLSVKLELRDINDVYSKIQDQQILLNKMSQKIFGENVNDKFIELRLDERHPFATSGATIKALQDISESKEKGGVPPNLLKDAGDFMGKHKDTRIVITDGFIPMVDEINALTTDTNISQFIGASGFTLLSNEHFFIIINGINEYNHKNYDKIVDYQYFKRTLTHEIGHVLDLRLGAAIYGKRTHFSEHNNAFLNAFAEAPSILTEDHFMYSEELFNGEKLSKVIKDRIPNVVEIIDTHLDYFSGIDVTPKKSKVPDQPIML